MRRRMSVGEYVEVLLSALPAEEKLLLFAHHHSVIDKLEARVAAMSSAGPSFYVRVDGQTPFLRREAAVARFQDDPDVRIALLSITACGVGLSFTAASTVVFGELISSSGRMEQAEDRVHRVGQRRSVDIHYLVAPGTLDDSTLSSLISKRHELKGILASNTHLVQQTADSAMCLDSEKNMDAAVVDAAVGDPGLDAGVEQLVAMGFDAGHATAAWEAADGNIEFAIELACSIGGG